MWPLISLLCLPSILDFKSVNQSINYNLLWFEAEMGSCLPNLQHYNWNLKKKNLSFFLSFTMFYRKISTPIWDINETVSDLDFKNQQLYVVVLRKLMINDDDGCQLIRSWIRVYCSLICLIGKKIDLHVKKLQMEFLRLSGYVFF